MDRSVQYAQVMSNFDSVYNVPPNSTHRQPPIYVPTSSFSARPSQSLSSSLNSSNPKFNFDLYQPNEYLTEFNDYQPSPSSSVIIHHHPVYSPPPSQAISKLRQVNDELCYTLAQSELPTYSPPSPSHHHIYHHPIPRPISHSHSLNQLDSSSESEEIEPRRHNARITYKVHIPRRRQQQLQKSTPDIDQLLLSTSDAYVQDDPLTVDVYPTRDQGYIRHVRNRPDNQKPWLPDEILVRRNSYSEASTYRTPRAPDYDHQLIQPKSRLSDCKERARSSSVKSRFRRDSAPNALRHSATAPVWRPNGSIKNPKFIGSNAPPSPRKPRREPAWNPSGIANKSKNFRAFDPTNKPSVKKDEPVWYPTSKEPKKKSIKHFAPTLKPELTVPIRSKTEPVVSKKPPKPSKLMTSADPQLKTRIAAAESKVKSAWESTTPANKPKPPVPRPVKPVTTTVPVKPKVKPVPFQSAKSGKKVVPTPAPAIDTGRSSVLGDPGRPQGQSTPRNQSFVNEEGDVLDGIFGNDSQITVQPKKIEKTPPKQPSPTVPKPDAKSTPTANAEVVVPGNDNNRSISPISAISKENGDETDINIDTTPAPSQRKEASPKPDNRDDDLPNLNDTDEDVDPNADVNEVDDNTERVNDDDVSKKEEDVPSTSVQRKESSAASEEPDEDSPRLPASSSLPPPSVPATTNHDADDFFD